MVTKYLQTGFGYQLQVPAKSLGLISAMYERVFSQ